MLREMMRHSARVAILADATKLERRRLAQIAELTEADYLVTDAPPPPSMAAALAEAGVEVLVPGDGADARG